MTTFYKAFDGKVFDCMDECLEYEKNNTSQVIESINIIKEFCNKFNLCDDRCPLYDDDNMCCQLYENPSNW